MDRAIEINHLSVVFHTESGQVHAVKDVSLTLKHGVITGLIGETGSGKSVMASAILRMLPSYAEVSGSIRYQGMEILEADHRTVRDLRRNHIGLIPQNPSESLNPARRILPQTAECFEGSRRERRNITYYNMEKMGLNNPEDTGRKYPFQLSGGMKQRAVSLFGMREQLDWMIADEPTTALDERIRWEILELFKEIRDKLGTSIVLVSHDLNAVRRVADRVCVMYAGKIIETGSTEEIFMCPGHPYTRALLKAMPDNTDRSELLYDIPGMPPMLIAPPKGDAFAARNIHALKIDFIREAPMFRMSDTHYAASWELADEETKAKEPELFEEAAADNDRGGSFEASLVAKPHTEKNFENDIILAVRDLSCTYMADRHTAVRAIDGLSFEVKRGEIFGIVGESGSGKSTLAKCIMNILKPDSGSIIYKGIDIWDRKAFTANKKMLNTSRQLIFQDSDSALDPRMKTADIIAEPMRIAWITPEYGSVREAAIRIMEAVGLDQSYADKYPSDMSGGQRQRAAIARALSMKPELIIADEALASLDVSVQAQIVNLFRKLQREYGFTLLFISHDKSMVRYLCDRAAVLDHGRLTEIVNGESFA